MRSTHPQKSLRFHVQRNWALAGLLAINVAMHHCLALPPSHLAIKNFAQRILGDIADWFLQEIAEPDIAGLKNGHGSQTNVAVSFMAAQIEMADAVKKRRIGE